MNIIRTHLHWETHLYSYTISIGYVTERECESISSEVAWKWKQITIRMQWNFFTTLRIGGERKWNIQSHTFTISMEINWNLNRWHVTDACFSDKYVPNHIVAFEYIPRHLNDFSCGISICAMHIFGCENMLKQKLITCIHEIRLTITVTFTHSVKNKNKNINISQ